MLDDCAEEQMGGERRLNSYEKKGKAEEVIIYLLALRVSR